MLTSIACPDPPARQTTICPLYSMFNLDLAYETITTITFVGLLIAIIFFSDLVAVIIIVVSVTGLALRWLSQQYDTGKGGWSEERRQWEEGERWW